MVLIQKAFHACETIDTGKDAIWLFWISFRSQLNTLKARITTCRIDQLKTELDKFKRTPLMLCTVKDVLEKEVVIQIPNGNEFLYFIRTFFFIVGTTC